MELRDAEIVHAAPSSAAHQDGIGLGMWHKGTATIGHR